ncbi:zinc finger protein 90-like isoform X1 [Littorina saxatilis]|uniref:zinc finger protein 90-like isoform X1 n=1 Tax=Littorina saxatilis TaxID=31220 RepID=UPI0038B41E5A
MPQCVAWGCHYRTDKKEPKGKGTSTTVHRFPKDPERRNIWTRALRREGFQATDTMVLCSSHFEESCFYRFGQTVRLEKTAVPTLFDFPLHLPVKKQQTRKAPAARTVTLKEDDPPSPSTCSSHAEVADRPKQAKGGRRKQLAGSLPTLGTPLPVRYVLTPQPQPEKQNQHSDDESQPRQTVSGCDRMEEEERTVKTEVKTERDTQEPLLVRLPVPQCTTEQHSQEPEVKTEVKTERDTQEPPLVRLPVSLCTTEQHSQEPEVKTEVKTERDTQEPPLVRLPVSEFMTEQHLQEPEVKIEIDVAEEPSLAWCMTQQHSHVSVEADFTTESTASIMKEQTTQTQAEFFYQSLSSQESVKHSNRQVSEHIKSESRDAEDTTVVTGDTQFIPTHQDEGAGAESSAMARDDTAQLTRSSYNSQSPSTQDGVSPEKSSVGLDHLYAYRSKSLKGESLHKEKKTEADVRPHRCTQCNSSFRCPSELKRHMVTHTGERPHTCAVCSASFRQSSTLKQHIITHTGERPYSCSQCSASFRQPSALKQHILTHTGERPYSCSQCSASFGRSYHLKNHILIHTGERPYTCSQCSASFSRPTTLKLHMVTHTGERPYRCAHCSSSFGQSTSLKRHMRTHTEERGKRSAQKHVPDDITINTEAEQFISTGSDGMWSMQRLINQ